VRFVWGPADLRATTADHVVIVDVLRFTTAVEAAASQACAFPYRWKDRTAAKFADNLHAVLAQVHTQPSSERLAPSSITVSFSVKWRAPVNT
jgi:2-phosphosulfolactate phosphatase